MTAAPSALSRAQGCLLGQLAGDALGSLVEFETPESIKRLYPQGVRLMQDGGTWNTIAGQPTDDSEMALTLACSLLDCGTYDEEAVRAGYESWYDSDPFDCGDTIAAALNGRADTHSQANGALMRISPLGIFGAGMSDKQMLVAWARQDASITHPHRICQEANVLYVLAIATVIQTGMNSEALYREVVAWTKEMKVAPALQKLVHASQSQRPVDCLTKGGWVLVAFQNALYQLLHAPDMEAGVVDTIMQGGDTDTNAAICGALLGAVYGIDAIPTQWRESVLNCRPEKGLAGVLHPRPKIYWPVDALNLAKRLLRQETWAVG